MMALCVSVCLSVVAFGGVGSLVDGSVILSVFVCLNMLAFGGVGHGLVSLCLVFCVFMMSLAVSVSLSKGAFGEVLSLCVWGYATIMVGKTDSLPLVFFVSYLFDARVLNGKANQIRVAVIRHTTRKEKMFFFSYVV